MDIYMNIFTDVDIDIDGRVLGGERFDGRHHVGICRQHTDLVKCLRTPTPFTFVY